MFSQDLYPEIAQVIGTSNALSSQKLSRSEHAKSRATHSRPRPFSPLNFLLIFYSPLGMMVNTLQATLSTRPRAGLRVRTSTSESTNLNRANVLVNIRPDSGHCFQRLGCLLEDSQDSTGFACDNVSLRKHKGRLAAFPKANWATRHNASWYNFTLTEL